MLIKDFTYRKVTDYLERDNPKKVILIFWHGLGDVLMFMPQYRKLQKMFPQVQIDMAIERNIGFDCFFENGHYTEVDNGDHPVPGYDYTFYISYWMSEGYFGSYTKSELCCVLELGMEPAPEGHPLIYVKRDPESKRVGVCFQSTALPDRMNCPEDIAEKIWNEILTAGFVPIETTMQHKWFNPANKKYSFIGESNCRYVQATINNLTKVISSCFANISVSTGNFHMAMSIMPERTCFIKHWADVSSYTKERVPQIDVLDYNAGMVSNWLKELKKLDNIEEIINE